MLLVGDHGLAGHNGTAIPIGLSLSDVERRIATPLVTLARTTFTKDAAALAEQVRKFDVFALIIGLPFNMEGDEGPRAQATRAFARNYGQRHPLPIAFWDERLSTAAVTRDLIANDVSRAKRKTVVDKLAAAMILETYLARARA